MAFISGVTRSYIDVKFDHTLQALSITNDNFSLSYTVVDPAIEINNPFKQIIVSDHYSSISRTLRLFFTDTASLQTGEHLLGIEGIRDAFGRLLVSDDVVFVYDYDNDTEEPPSHERDSWPEVTDYSINIDPFSNISVIKAANEDFYMVRSDPSIGDAFVDPKYNKGTITADFSNSPSSVFVNKDYIKVQKKRLGFPVSRWEDINANLMLDSSRPRIYINLPSLETEVTIDDEPIIEEAGQYGVDGLDYFELQYKYRVRILSEFGMNSVVQ